MNSSDESRDSLPKREEINVYDSLDERCACDNFLGKNLEEAEALFRDNFLYYQEDLMFMGPRAFRYYVYAAIRFLRSADAHGDSDAASTFESLLGLRLKQEPDELRPIAHDLAEICTWAGANIARFECSPEIYGDVGGRYAALAKALQELATTPP